MKRHAAMNRAYRVIRSGATGAFVAVSERTRGHARSSSGGAVAAAVLLLCSGAVQAGPNGGVVTAGSASISVQGATTNITQSSSNVSLNWNTFNIGARETVNFLQPGASSVAVNRVLDTNASQIFGHLNANGQVFLINPNGVLFGAGAQVNVGGLVASTLDITDASAASANRVFAGNGNGSVINQGTLTAGSGGYLALLGNTVDNQGVLSAQLGTVALGAGRAATLSFAGNRLVQFSVDQGVLNAAAANHGLVQADGGTVFMNAGAKSSLLASVVNNAGVIQARGVQSQDGRVFLTGGDQAGQVQLGGTVDVSSTVAGGGSVVATAQQVTVAAGALINADGASAGGRIDIGSAWQGAAGVSQAVAVDVAPTAVLQASALQHGNGGEVVVRADPANPASTAAVHGTLRADGAGAGSTGGRVETSAYRLDTAGVQVSAAAPQGSGGTWLLDPDLVDITATGGAGPAYSAYSPISYQSAASIATSLNNGTNVTVTANSSTMSDIAVDAPITRTNAGSAATLTLSATNTIVINQPITSTGGAVNVSLLADSDHNGVGIVILKNNISTNGGSLTFGANASGTLWGGGTYVGANASDSTQGVAISTAGGNVVFNGQLIIANSNGFTIDSNTGYAAAGASRPGDVTFNSIVDSGDTYALSSNSLTWVNALNAAKAGTGGNVGDTYLATITSSLENAVASYTSNYSPSWLGGERVVGLTIANSTLPLTSGSTTSTQYNQNGVWRWVTGPEGLMNIDGYNGLPFFAQNGSNTSNGSSGFAIAGRYTNWNNGEPNNSGGATLAQAGENVIQFVGNAGQWNDLANNSQSLKFLKETNLAPSSLSVNAGTTANGGTVTFAGGIGSVKVLNNVNITGATVNLPAAPVINTSGSSTIDANVNSGGVAKTLVTVSAPTESIQYGQTATYTASCSGTDCTSYSMANVTITPSATVSGTGIYSLVASGLTATGNDLIVYSNGALTVQPRTVGLTATKVYNGNTLLTGSQVTITTGVNGETLSYSGATANSMDVGSGNYISAITLVSGTGNASNYTLPTLDAINAPVTITPISLSVNGTISANSRTYNGTRTATLSGGSLGSGVLGVDAPNVQLSQTALFADKNVGNGIVVTPTFALTGSKAVDYSLVQPSVALTANITLAPLTVTANAVTKTYDGTITVTGVNPTVGALAGAGAGESVNTAATEAFTTASAGAGNKTVTASGLTIKDSLGADVTANYQISYVSNTVSTINKAALVVTANSATKGYDGSTSISTVTPTVGVLAGAAAGDTLDATSESFATPGVGSGNKVINANAITIHNGAVDATGNYQISYVPNSTGTITVAPLTVTAAAVSKVYDGTANASTAALVIDPLAGAAAGDHVTASSLSYDDKNVGTAKVVRPGTLVIRDTLGNDVTANYNITYTSAPVGTITRLSSVAWVGGPTGNWFDPANWAGGAVPDLSNVANVSIPAGTTVTMGTTVVSPASPGAVNVDSVGTGGSLAVSGATLNVGAGGMTLAGFTESSGTVGVSGAVTLGSFTQTGGTFTAGGNFSTSNGFSQTGGSASVTGITQIAASAAPVVLGNLTSTGALSVNSTGGSITQVPGSTLTTGSTSSFTASNGAVPADILLGNSGNQLAPTVALNGANVAVADSLALHLDTVIASGNLSVRGTGGLDLGTTSVTGNLLADSGNGALTQTGALSVGGTTGLTAGTGNIDLGNPANTLTGAVNASGNNIAIADASALQLGNVNATGNLTASGTGGLDLGTTHVAGNLLADSGNGALTQTGALSVGGTTGLTAGTGNVALTNPANALTGAVSASGNNISIADAAALQLGTVNATGNLTASGTGGLDLGTTHVTGNLVADSGNGPLTQTGALSVGGTTGLTAGTGNIDLGNPANTLTGAVNASGNNIAIADASALQLGNVNATGNLTASGTGGLDLGTTHVGGNLLADSGNGALTQTGALSVGGTTGLTAGTGNIVLANPANTLTGAVNANGNNITLVDAAALNLSSVTSTGNVSASSAAALTVGTANVSGNFSATSGGTVRLGNTSTGGNLNVTASGGLDLGTTAVGGNLTADSGNGAVTQVGALQVQGTSIINAGTGSIALANPANVLGGHATFTGATVTVRGSGAGVPMNGVSPVTSITQMGTQTQALLVALTVPASPASTTSPAAGASPVLAPSTLAAGVADTGATAPLGATATASTTPGGTTSTTSTTTASSGTGTTSVTASSIPGLPAKLVHIMNGGVRMPVSYLSTPSPSVP